MDLRKAMEAVIRDLLDNTQGDIGFEDITNATPEKLDKLTKVLVNSDEFLMRFTSMGEELINEFFEDFGDEYGINE